MMSVSTGSIDLERLRAAEAQFMAGRFAEAGSAFAALARLDSGLAGPVLGYGGGGPQAFVTAESEAMTLGAWRKAPAQCVIAPAFPLEHCKRQINHILPRISVNV
ncbi:MAG: hypothetical protein ABR553_07825 [Gammaproteobacteria bacterium]